MYPELLLVLLVMLASPGQSAVEDGAARHQSQHYNNVFFSDPPHMKGRPSTSFVMVKSVDGRAYQLSHSGHQVTYTGPGDSASVEAPPSCPPMSPKPAAMCPPGSEVDTCQGDGDCVGPGHAGHVALCCYNGCGANACLAASHVVPRSVVATTTDTCPVVETKTEQQCANATANCWSRGVPDVDCPDFGLCCFDGCVNTCYVAPEETEEEEEEEDLEYDQTLADAIEEDYDDELDDELDEELVGYQEGDQIEFTVFDYDRASAADLLGRVKLPSTAFDFEGGFEGDLKLLEGGHKASRLWPDRYTMSTAMDWRHGAAP